jgi:DNA-binding PadR family transcriptional regulator
MKDDFAAFLPLAPASLHILLSLAGVKRHGYGIMQEVTRQSEGKYKLGPGTLYDNLQKLMNQGLVDEVPRPSEPRRRYYQLTSAGRGVLSAEVIRLEEVVRTARQSLKLARPGAAS